MEEEEERVMSFNKLVANSVAALSKRVKSIEDAHRPGDGDSLTDALNKIRRRLDNLEKMAATTKESGYRTQNELNVLKSAVMDAIDERQSEDRAIRQFLIRGMSAAGALPQDDCKDCKKQKSMELPELPEGRDPVARLKAAIGNMNKALMDCKKAGKKVSVDVNGERVHMFYAGD